MLGAVTRPKVVPITAAGYLGHHTPANGSETGFIIRRFLQRPVNLGANIQRLLPLANGYYLLNCGRNTLPPASCPVASSIMRAATASITRLFSSAY